MNQSGKMKIILEAAVARLNKRRYRKPVGTWVAALAQATELPMKQLLFPMRAASLPCPHWRPFSELQSHHKGDQIFPSSRKKNQ